jgi:hypothetical protein
MNNLPVYISLIFVLTTILTVALFYKAAHRSRNFLIVMLAWLIIQTLLGLRMFYIITTTIPPRIILLGLPPLLIICCLFLTTRGKYFLDGLDIKWLTMLHVVRMPVELVLLWLSINKVIPQLMTFEGRNFDILSGITAPLIYYFIFVRNNFSKKILLAWNFICLALLLNIVVNAVLSVPTAFQQFAFDQPNIAILYFPFNLLPAVVVPLVLLSHLAAIRKLLCQDEIIPVK